MSFFEATKFSCNHDCQATYHDGYPGMVLKTQSLEDSETVVRWRRSDFKPMNASNRGLTRYGDRRRKPGKYAAISSEFKPIGS